MLADKLTFENQLYSEVKWKTHLNWEYKSGGAFNLIYLPDFLSLEFEVCLTQMELFRMFPSLSNK